MTKVRFTSDGAVCYIPPAPEDAVETFVEQAAAKFRKAGPRMTMRGGFTLDDLRRAQANTFDEVTPPFPLERVKSQRFMEVAAERSPVQSRGTDDSSRTSRPGASANCVRVLGIRIGGCR